MGTINKGIETVSTFKLAEIILSKSAIDFEKEALEKAKISLLDFIGVSLRGSKEPSVAVLLDFYSQMYGENKFAGVNVMGNSLKLPLLEAVIVNGSAAHSLDLDDTGASTQSHPSAILFPALLGLSELNKVSGERLLKAYVVGVEVLNLLSKSLPFLHSKGWHPSSVFGSIASAVSCGLALNLDCCQLANAIGIAASSSSGLIGNFGSFTKHLHIGKASANGLEAALLAREGFTSSFSILHGPKSFFSAFGFDQPDWEELLTHFANPWAIISPGLNFKQYPSCALSHRLIDCALNLKESFDFYPEDIEWINCRATPRAKEILFYHFPNEGLQGKFSIYYLISRALYYGGISFSDFTKEKVTETHIRELMRRITFDIHENWDELGDDWYPDIIEIKLKNGQLLHSESKFPLGHSKNPFPIDSLKNKFRDCVRGFIDEDHIGRLFLEIESLENSVDVTTLINFIRVK